MYSVRIDVTNFQLYTYRSPIYLKVAIIVAVAELVFHSAILAEVRIHGRQRTNHRANCSVLWHGVLGAVGGKVGAVVVDVLNSD